MASRFSVIVRVVVVTSMAAVGLTALSLSDLPQPASATPTITFAGDPAFDSDSISSSDPVTQPRWDSLPGSRWGFGVYGNSAIDGVLGLNMGGYVASGPQTVSSIVAVGLGPHGGATTASSTRGSTWYPYKETFHGEWSSYGSITGTDFFASKDSVVRLLHVNPSAGPDVTLAGSLPGGTGASWDGTSRSLKIGNGSWGYAMTFYQGTSPTQLTLTPSWTSTGWSLVIPSVATGIDLEIAIGFWAGSEGASAGVTRSTAAAAASSSATIAADKAQMDTLLRSVPAPTHWGISGVNVVGTTAGADVTGSVQQKQYYRAWAFAVQQTIDQQSDFAAAGVNYPLVAAGKPTLNAGFNTLIPSMAASDPWDSLVGMQLLAYVPAERSEAIAALHGVLALNVQGSIFYGERLPSRVAQTAWVLYQQEKATNPSQALTDLQSLYPSLKAFLLYMEQHPSWDLDNDGKNPDEHDIEYVSSWLFDVGFFKQIASVLGQTADQSDFQTRSATEMSNLRAWFFSDPTQIFTFYYSNPSKVDKHYSCSTALIPSCAPSEQRDPPRAVDVPASILTTLAVPGLPADLRDRLIQYWLNGHETAAYGAPSYDAFDPTVGSAGLTGSKYPDTSLIALGAIANVAGPTPFQLVNAAARDAAYANDFSEYLFPGNGLVASAGQKTSLFSAVQLIDFTLLQNGYSIGQQGEVLTGPRDGVLYSGFESGDLAVTALNTPTGPGVNGVTGICCGATGPLSVPVVGGARSGQSSLFYSGSSTGSGENYAYMKVFDLSSPMLVGSGTTLQYSIYPDSSADSANVSGNTSSYVALDLVFDDGTRLSTSGAVDQHGDPTTAQGQGDAGHHALHAWNRVITVVPPSAVGKHVTQVILDYDQTGGPHGGFAGFVDDVSLADGYYG